MKYRILIQRDERGMFTAECPALPGCVSQGTTTEEVLRNIRQAILGHIESLRERNEPIPAPDGDAEADSPGASSKKMRLFTAIEIPEDVRRHLLQLCGQLNTNKTIDAQNFHVTLSFLGEVEEARLPTIRDVLKKIPPAGAVTMCVDRLECFPLRGPVRVVAFGLGGDVGRIQQLHERVRQACEQLGCEPERRAYTPHITVSRHRNPLTADKRLQLARAVSPDLPGPPFVAREFVLMQSLLKPQGPQYIPLARFPL